MGEEDFMEEGVTNGVDCFKVNLVKEIIEFGNMEVISHLVTQPLFDKRSLCQVQ